MRDAQLLRAASAAASTPPRTLRRCPVIHSYLHLQGLDNIPMLIFLVVVHVIICLFLIGVVLLQQGKSADLAGAFGGQGSQTAFGPRGAANLLTKLTTWGAVLFMVVSISLTVMLGRSHVDRSVLSGTPTQHSTPKK